MSTTFYQLFNDGRWDWVEIPIIQRDYAQGRPEHSTVRDEFLNALLKTLRLPLGSNTPKLDLDFIYGSIVKGSVKPINCRGQSSRHDTDLGNDVRDSFQPLDGQQRLTTLFLLHWYLSCADNCFEDFRTHFVKEGRSRFRYEVRSSSREFFDAFVLFNANVAAADDREFADYIADQPWFFRRWRFDPTIQSSLNMLEEIHTRFRKAGVSYARLTDEQFPAITFSLLSIKEFNLSDEVYIKMNARGIPLTYFETFKARFEQHLKKKKFKKIRLDLCDQFTVYEYFSMQIDGAWSDFLWRSRCEMQIETSFDDAMLNLVREVIVATRLQKWPDLRNLTQPKSYNWIYSDFWFDKEMIEALITLLHKWSSAENASFSYYLPEVGYIDKVDSMDERFEMKLFKSIITGSSFLTL